MNGMDGKRKLPERFVYEINMSKCSLTSGNIKHCSLEEADLPKDHQRKIVPPITALLKGYVLISMTPAHFSQWIFHPRSVKL